MSESKSVINFASKTRSKYHGNINNEKDCVADSCPCKGIIVTSSVFTASEQNDVNALSKRVEQNPSVVNKRDDFGYTPLHFAAQHNNITIMNVLIDQNADVDASDCGATPLHRAAFNGHFDACKLLLESGADPNLIDVSFMDKRTALHKAASNGHKKVMDLLIAYGADGSILDVKGLTAEVIYGLVVADRDEKETVMTTSLNANDKPTESMDQSSNNNRISADEKRIDASFSKPIATKESTMSMGIICPSCGNTSLLFSRYCRGGLVCLNCYSKR